MSRFEWDGDYESPKPGQAELFARRAQTAIYSRRGRAALAELREALMALPKHELIEGAVCRRVVLDEVDERDPVPVPTGQLTVDGSAPPITPIRFEEDGELVQVLGVCAIGAYVWWKKVKAGMDPVQAFAALPAVDSGEDGDDAEGDEMFQTAWTGQAAGLTYTLAWELASGNDERWHKLTPPERWQAFVDWIDKVQAAPPLRRGQPAPGERLGYSWSG